MVYNLTGKIKDISADVRSGRVSLTLSINEKHNVMQCYDKLKECEKLSVKIDKYRDKRSLDANAYAWKLMTEIGNVMRADKELIYRMMLVRYGQRETISVQAHISIAGFIKYYDEIGESETNGKLFKHYYVYKGSSEFDTREMAVFIDGIVDEAKELGIPTETPNELAKMKSLWGADDEKHNAS